MMVELFLSLFQLLNVNGVHHALAFHFGGFVEGLTLAEFLYNAGLFEFSFELLQGFFDVVAFFNRYYDHSVFNYCFCFVF